MVWVVKAGLEWSESKSGTEQIPIWQFSADQLRVLDNSVPSIDTTVVTDMPTADARRYMFAEWRATPIEEGASAEETVSIPGTAAAFPDADGVIYKTTFDDPRETDDEVAVLELDGLYAHSEVEVTGSLLVDEEPIQHDTYYEPLQIPFEPAGEADNQLVVTCHKPRDRFGGLHETAVVPDERAVPGIWWGASLEARSVPYIESMDVRAEIAGGEVTLHVTLTVVTDGPLDESVTYSVKPTGDLTARGMMQRGSIDVDRGGRHTVEHTVEAMNPSLWWPRDLGEQNRYQIRAKLDDCEHTVTTGICDIRYEDGALVVNDELVPIRGVNVLPGDVDDIDRVIECNANLVRAHGHVLPKSFYEACDEAGILVWQDLPLTGDGEFDVERGRDLASSLARVYARHPSLAAFGVHDDPVSPFADGLGSGFLDRLRLRWRAWRSDYDHGPATEVAEALGDAKPVFPVVGGPGIDADAAAYYPGWQYGEASDIDTLLDRYPADVVAEYGAGSVGEDDTDVELHLLDRHADDPAQSRSYQADVVSTISERLRCAGVGAIAFCLRDLGPAGMGVYGAAGDPKPAQEAIATAFEPTQAFLEDPTGDTSQVVVVNDRPQGMTATLNWEAGEEDGAMDLTLTAQGVLTGEPIPLPDDAEDLTLRLETDRFTVENTYEF